MAKNTGFAPHLSAYYNGVYVKTKSIELTQTAYSVTDTLELNTWVHSNPDWSALASTYASGRVPITLRAGSSKNAVNFNNKNATQIMYGFLDEIEEEYDTDEGSIRGLGVLSSLSDFPITQKAYMNVDAGQAISELIKSRGLIPQVDKAGVTVGHILTDDNASIGRNIRAIEFINTLARGLNWTVRVQNNTVIVGYPPDRNSVPVIEKTWNKNAGMTLKVTHNPYSSKNIKVRVVSFLPRLKSKVRAKPSVNDPYIQQLLAGQTMNVPTPTSAKKSTSRGGRTVGFVSGPQSESAAEEYVYNFPHKTKAQCDAIASRIEADLAMHEYLVTLEFTPTEAELNILAQNSPNFLISLTGLKPSANGLYHMKHVRWKNDFDEGLTLECLMANHEIPTNTGGE